jgi:two-component system response regulator NreC
VLTGKGVMAARTAIVDDHRLFREGVKALLSAQDDIRIVAEADSARAGKLIVEREDVDILLVDWRLPDVPGDVFMREAHRKRPSLKLVALTMFTDEQHIAEAFAAGAVAYVGKDAPTSELLEAIRTVHRGGRYLPPAFASRASALMSGQVNGRDGNGYALNGLTRREREIFALVVRGLRTSEIAAQLEISTRTIETHRARILRKLRAHSTGDLVRYAAVHGLLDV